jgi:hypothetical protein
MTMSTVHYQRSTSDSEPHLFDHDYYIKESVDLNDTSKLFSVHSHVNRKSENGETDMIYDDTYVAETVDITFDHFENMYHELVMAPLQTDFFQLAVDDPINPHGNSILFNILFIKTLKNINVHVVVFN